MNIDYGMLLSEYLCIRSCLSFNASDGNISKKWLTWGDTYQLNIYNEELQDLFVAVVIAVDHLIDASRNN